MGDIAFFEYQMLEWGNGSVGDAYEGVVYDVDT